MAHVGPASPDLRRGKATVPRTFLLRGLAKCETAPFSLFSRHGCLQNGIRFSDWWSSSYNYGVQITCYRQEVHRILYVAGVRFRLPNHVYLGSSGNKECTDTRVWIFHEWQRNQAEKLSIRLSNTKERMNDRKVERKETNKNRPLENWTILLFTTVVCVLWIFLFVSGSFGAYVDQANCIAPVFPTVHNIISYGRMPVLSISGQICSCRHGSWKFTVMQHVILLSIIIWYAYHRLLDKTLCTSTSACVFVIHGFYGKREILPLLFWKLLSVISPPG